MNDGHHANEEPARVGIDIGGTKIEGVLLDGFGTVISSCRIPSRPGEDRVIEDICRTVSALTTDFVPVGIGIPGQVDYLTGQVNNVVNLGIEQLGLAERVSRRTKSPVHVEMMSTLRLWARPASGRCSNCGHRRTLPCRI